jgi:hypothetical protein
MFRQIMLTQLRWTRLMVAIMTVAAFVTPAAAWWMGGTRVEYPARPAAVVIGFQSAGPMIVGIALLGAFLLAAYPWTMDAATRHVLPLSLPIPWRRYVAMRFGAGALLLIPPTIALWVGCLVVLGMIDLPATLRAYPTALALRFLAAAMLTYSTVFALQYMAGRRSALVALGIVVTVGALSFGLSVTGNSEFGAMFMDWLTEFPGPLAVFSTEWKLIDV